MNELQHLTDPINGNIFPENLSISYGTIADRVRRAFFLPNLLNFDDLKLN